MTGYHPEMGEKQPADTQIQAQLSHYGRHYYLKVAPGVTLSGRGVEFIETLTEANLVPGSRYVGWTRYKVTMAAFKRIDAAYRVSAEMLL